MQGAGVLVGVRSRERRGHSARWWQRTGHQRHRKWRRQLREPKPCANILSSSRSGLEPADAACGGVPAGSGRGPLGRGGLGFGAPGPAPTRGVPFRTMRRGRGPGGSPRVPQQPAPGHSPCPAPAASGRLRGPGPGAAADGPARRVLVDVLHCTSRGCAAASY